MSLTKERAKQNKNNAKKKKIILQEKPFTINWQHENKQTKIPFRRWARVEHEQTSFTDGHERSVQRESERPLGYNRKSSAVHLTSHS